MPQTVAGITLQEGEAVEHDFRPRSGLLGTIFWLTVIVLTVGLALPLLWWARRRRPRYIVTDRRVIRKKGKINSSTDEFRLDDVSRIQTSRSLGERLRGAGTITVDTGPDELTLPRVPEHSAVVATIREGQGG